jgi:hypothetical protein
MEGLAPVSLGVAFESEIAPLACAIEAPILKQDSAQV